MLRWMDTEFWDSVLRLSPKMKALCLHASPSLLFLVRRRLLAEGRFKAKGAGLPWGFFF